MKTIHYFATILLLSAGLLNVTALQGADAETNGATVVAAGQTNTTSAISETNVAVTPAVAVSPSSASSDAGMASATNSPTPMPAEFPALSNGTNNVAATLATTNGELRLNFRGVPLEMVLNYLSDAAGFIINPEVDVKGKVDVWSNQPLSKREAVELLQTILAKNGYGVIQNGRILTIVTRDDARKRDIPVRSGNNPERIPKDEQIVTQIIPVRSLNAVQLTKDLAPLLPSDTTMTANESGNSLVITDTQQNIHRITEIIAALDSVSSSVNSLHVFPLKYADAKTLVSVIEKLFPSQDANSRNGQGGGGFFGRFGRGFGGFGGPFGGGPPGGGGGGGDSSEGHTPTTHVSATSDDHSNSLIVSAPDALMPTISELVQSVDTPVEDDTAVRVFHLRNADPGEMADLLTNLFPDDSNSSDASRNTPQFFPRFPFGGPGGQQRGQSSSDQSDRMKRLGRVIAVPDKRTRSVVVTAAKTLMPQIEDMVAELDQSEANVQHVYTVTLQNADPADVEQVLQDLFPTSNNSRTGSSGSTLQNNPLQNRSQTLEQQQLSGSGSSSLGTSFGSGTGRVGN